MAKDISKRIRKLRKAMKLTQSQFAELVNLSEDSIGKIERGVSTPTVDTLRKIAKGTNITFERLLYESKEEIKSQNQPLENFITYLKAMSPEDVRLIHEVAVKILERREKKNKKVDR